MPTRLTLLAAVLAVFAFTPFARAADVTIGSDLAAPATLEYHDPNDWAAWNPDMLQAPAQGEINVVNLKGRINPEGRAAPIRPDVVMHVMVLRPQGDGSVAVAPGGVSEDLPLPFGGDANQVSTYTRANLTKPDGADGKGGTRLCVQKGDYIAFTTSGGFGGFAQDNPEQVYVNGAEFQVFAPSRTTTTLFHNQGREYGYDPFRPSFGDSRELLMNVTIGTRENARYSCRTDSEKAENLDAKPAAPSVTPSPYAVATPTPAPVGRATLVKPRKAPKVKRTKVKLALKCSTVGACSGTLALRTYTKAAKFLLAAGQTKRVTLTLNKKARKKLKRKGARLTVKAMLVSADGSKQSLRFKIKKA